MAATSLPLQQPGVSVATTIATKYVDIRLTLTLTRNGCTQYNDGPGHSKLTYPSFNAEVVINCSLVPTSVNKGVSKKPTPNATKVTRAARVP